MTINKNANYILNKLHKSGYKAYLVGGCVRDIYMGRTPNDWDITTSATTDEIKEVFKEHTIYNTGEMHGTLTVNVKNEYFEVTTLRIDGEYSDSRHPDSVDFVANVEDDLARRDFTINAIAYNKKEGFIDPFGGLNDIDNGVISCVGNADERFQEDALRILRAIRFSARYGFMIDSKTLIAMYNNTLTGALGKISKERIRDELVKTLDSKYGCHAIYKHYGIICNIIPELAPCVGFKQNNKYHIFDVFSHIMAALYAYKGDDTNVKLALLFHDIGKPDAYFENETGGHFYGHSEISAKLTEEIMRRLRFPAKDIDEVTKLVKCHDVNIEPTIRSVRKALNNYGETMIRKLLVIQAADISAHSPLGREERTNKVSKIELLIDVVTSRNLCCNLKSLAVSGNDIIALGVPEGKEIGNLLHYLLDAVLNGEDNTYENLIRLAKEHISNNGELKG